MADKTLIKLFDGKQVRIVWNEKEEKYYFAVADVVQVLTDSEDVKQYIKKMRARDPELNSNWGTICTPVEMLAPDGKHRVWHTARCRRYDRCLRWPGVPGCRNVGGGDLLAIDSLLSEGRGARRPEIL